MTKSLKRWAPERAAGLLAVLAAHGAVFYGLWQQSQLPAPREAVTLFVDLIAPPRPQPPAKAELPVAKARPAEALQPRRIAAETPALSPSDPVAAPQPPASPVAEAAPAASPPGPIALQDELSVSCPERVPPKYPLLSRRLGEEGKLVLRVELDERGHVVSAQVATGSGHARLDEAAFAAVRNWRCNPARRDGRPVRAVALQPFNFILEGH